MPVKHGSHLGRRGPFTEDGIELMEESDFKLFQALIHREAGIWLPKTKRAMLTARLTARRRALGWPAFVTYYRIVRDDPVERVRMLDCVCTNQTRFFREPQHFDLLENGVFPAMRARLLPERRIRVWSAGCSTGEEPFSLAMHLLANFPATTGWQIEILATDLSTRVLEQAREASWPVEHAADVPPAYLKRFMLRGTGASEGVMKAAPEIRQLVHFTRLNLNSSAYPFRRSFHLIFCRNVLIYFNVQTRRRVVARLTEHLAPGGYLFLGHAENVTGVVDGLRPVVPTVYERYVHTAA